MSVVYEALDERLDRPVALKLMLVDDGERERVRLLREAQALARLSHPNVVEVFEIGEHDGKAFVAMELVEGHTLDRWLRLRRRTRHEIVALFIQAGQGLVAAHEQGLVHRDFKPGNVLVGTDGRTRVADFGLVRDSTGDDPSAESAPAEPRPEDSMHAALSAPAWDKTLTRTGSLVGTPAYMSPEQIGGRPAGAASDQFSFCVALFEALHGRHPFVAGDDWKQLPTNVLRGLVQRPSGSQRSTPALDRVLDRGLKVDPKERWPSMLDLLEQLHRALEPRRRRTGTIALGLGVLGVALWASNPLTPATAGSRCEDAAMAMKSAWSQDQRTRLQAKWRGSDLPGAADTWTRADARLILYVDDWWSVHRSACQAETRAVATATCLQRQAENLQVHLDVIGTPDEALLHNLVPMIGELPAPDRCGARQQTAQADAEPHGPSWATELAEIDARLAAGRYDEAAPRIEALAAQAELEGTPQLRAQMGLRMGMLQNMHGELDAAAQSFEDAYLGAKPLGLDDVSVPAALHLLRLHGETRYRAAEAQRWMGHARAEVERTGDPSYISQFLNAAGRARRSADDFEGALQLHQQALELQRQHLTAANPDIALSLFQIGTCLAMLGRVEAGLEHLGESLEMYRQTLGPRHPRTTAPLTNIGVFQLASGQDDRALETFQHVLEVMLEVFPDNPIYSRFAYINISGILQQQGRRKEAAQTLRHFLGRYQEAVQGDGFDEGLFEQHTCQAFSLERDLDAAVTHCRRALAAYEQELGPEHSKAADMLGRLGDLEFQRGRLDDSIAYQERALAKRRHAHDQTTTVERLLALAQVQRAQGQEHEARINLDEAEQVVTQLEAVSPMLRAKLDTFMVVAQLEAGEHAEALTRARAGVLRLEEAVATDSHHLIQPLSVLADAERIHGNQDEALRHARRAVELVEASAGAREPDAAWAHFVLAQSLPRNDQVAAVALAREARELLAAEGPAYRRDLERIDAWLGEHH